jgi:hypothetical protein
MNTTTILDLIAARETAASAARDELREQMNKLAGEAAAIESELADLATTRQTLKPPRWRKDQNSSDTAARS